MIRRLRESPTGSSMPIVVVSGSSGEGRSEFRAMRLGANTFLAKPIDTADLAKRIRDLVSSKLQLTPPGAA